MRQVKRIPIIKKVLKETKTKRKLYKLFEYIKGGIKASGFDFKIHDYVDYFYKNKTLFEFWKQNPDLRFTQLLINTGILPNFPGFWYYLEDEELFIKAGLLKPRDIYFWGINYDIKNKKLKNTKYKLIKDLDTDHIKVLVNNDICGRMYKELLLEELRLRNDSI